MQGIGGGALISTAQAIIFDVFPPEERAIGMAIFGISVMVGPALGPTLGGWITENFSWPWIFYINLPVGLLAGSLCWRLVPEPETKLSRSTSIDWLGVALLALGIGSLQVLLERGGAHDWFQSTEIRIEAALAALGVGLFIWHELTTEHPIVDLRILRNRQLAAGMTFGAALGFALYSSVFALPVFMQNVIGLGPEETGWVMLPGALASAATMAVMGRINSRVDVRGLIALGIGIFFVSMLLHSRFTAEVGTGDIVFPLILRGIGLGMIFPPLTAAAIADLRPAQYGQGTGLYSLARQLGGSFGIAAIATVVTRYSEHAREALRAHVNPAEPATLARIEGLTRTFQTLGGSLEQADRPRLGRPGPAGPEAGGGDRVRSGVSPDGRGLPRGDSPALPASRPAGFGARPGAATSLRPPAPWRRAALPGGPPRGRDSPRPAESIPPRAGGRARRRGRETTGRRGGSRWRRS